MVQAVSCVKMKPEIKDAHGKYIAFPDTSKIYQMLNQDGEFSSNLLANCYRRYITYSHICIYKVKSNKAITAVQSDPDRNSFDYKDDMIHSLHMINDDEGYLDKNDKYHCDDDRIVGRRVLKRGEFIYIYEPPTVSWDITMAKMLERALYRNMNLTVEEVLHVDKRLVEEHITGIILEPVLRSRLIRTTIKSRIMPTLEFFKNCIERDLGLADGMRIVLSTEDVDDWQKVWDIKSRQ
jgi:hypothetical protein